MGVPARLSGRWFEGLQSTPSLMTVGVLRRHGRDGSTPSSTPSKPGVIKACAHEVLDHIGHLVVEQGWDVAVIFAGHPDELHKMPRYARGTKVPPTVLERNNAVLGAGNQQLMTAEDRSEPGEGGLAATGRLETSVKLRPRSNHPGTSVISCSMVINLVRILSR